MVSLLAAEFWVILQAADDVPERILLHQVVDELHVVHHDDGLHDGVEVTQTLAVFNVLTLPEQRQQLWQVTPAKKKHFQVS